MNNIGNRSRLLLVLDLVEVMHKDGDLDNIESIFARHGYTEDEIEESDLIVGLMGLTEILLGLAMASREQGREAFLQSLREIIRDIKQDAVEGWLPE